jgi:hypothetical protein
MAGFSGLGLSARSGPDMRMLSSSGGAHSSYRDMFSTRGSGPGVGIFPGGATYSSGRFGSGMFNFSATALYGSASRPGATGFATPKNAGPAVALKLTF